ncbi:MAG TPA: hypothetical protein VIP80_10610 [Gemmatimonadales bacterium]
MADVHDLLRRLLAGQGHGAGEFRWHHVLSLLMRLREERSLDSATVLQEIAEFEGRLTFDGAEGHPHSMPPADLVRTIAVQILAEWDLEQYRDTIVRAADLALSHPARSIARQLVG